MRINDPVEVYNKIQQEKRDKYLNYIRYSQERAYIQANNLFKEKLLANIELNDEKINQAINWNYEK